VDNTEGVAAQTPEKDKSLALFKNKWPGDVGERGFAGVPKCIITCRSELGLKPIEKDVLEIIIEKCWKVGDVAWPSVDYIATCLGRKKSSIIAATTCLARNGWITKDRRFNTSNIYSLEPAIKKLNAHLAHCQHYSKNLEQHNQKSGRTDDQNTGDYIDSNLTRTTYIQPFIASPDSLFGSHDLFPKYNKENNAVKDEYIPYNHTLGRYHKHDWEEFTQERTLANGEEVLYYYRNCKSCDMQFHKKGEWPWVGEY
jgi:Helix-turn-helix domain